MYLFPPILGEKYELNGSFKIKSQSMIFITPTLIKNMCDPYAIQTL